MQELGHAGAADNLGEHTDKNEEYGEYENCCIQLADIGLQSDGGEEDRPKQHVRLNVCLAVDVRGITKGTEDNTGTVGTCDVCNAEEVLGNIRKRECQCKCQNRDALCMRPAGIHPLEDLVDQDTGTDCEDKEQTCVHQDLAEIGGGILEANDDGQNKNTDDIIDDGSRQDGLAHFAIEFS